MNLKRLLLSVAFLFITTEPLFSTVKPGIEVLLESRLYQRQLHGKSLGLITNHTGVDSNLRSTIDLLYENPHFNLVALFAPEHGLRGNLLAGEKVRETIDERTHLPIHSLYGATRKPTKEMLRGIDTLIFDIQDIGVRTYTYISTLFLVMEVANEEGKELFILDRPNPLGGLNVEGPVLEPRYRSFIGILPIPLVHGMTVGELANFIKREYNMKNLRLTVVPMKGWRRNMTWRDTHLPWVPTSPHIPTVESAFLYATTGTIGSRNLNNGVGYTLPFQLIGNEWIDPYQLAGKLNLKNIPGVKFQPYWFRPFYMGFKDKQLKGVRLHLTDERNFRPVKTALEILHALESLYPGLYEPPRNFNKIWGVDYVLTEIRKGKTPSQIIRMGEGDLRDFKRKREKYLLYY